MSQPEPATSGIHTPETQVGSVFVSNYPPFSAWSEEAVPLAEQVLDTPPDAAALAAPFGLYLHVPFCRRRCKFCYFRVYTDKNAAEIGRYSEALAREVELYAERPALAGRDLGFVYFGGGTPSYISVRHLEALAGRVRAAMSWDRVEEVTFECEPGTLTRSKLETIRGIGVTRLSLGVENFDDEILRENGRAHLSHEIRRVAPWIAELDFPQLNVDLIAGMVGERWESWRETVDKTLELDPDSVTVYQMELPFNARYSQQLLEGRLATPLADWETKRAWHDYAFERFAEAGYEVSSAYTVVKRGSGARFVYRDALWHGADLIGTGVASFGHLQGLHCQNTAGWDPYLEGVEAGRLPLSRAYRTTEEDRLTRETILQLKLGGIDTGELGRKFGIDPLERFGPALERLEDAGMLAVRRTPRGGRIELSRQGLLQVDSLLPELYDERFRGGRYT
jgi:oxygen-independent coproporphyrinogen-3 oxidase